jgi:hypothetical protein
LAAYYHWDDNQSLTQALWVASKNKIDIEDLTQWSIKEKSLDKFQEFINRLNSMH